MYYYFQFHNISSDSQTDLPYSIIFNFVTTFIRQEYHVSMPENTSKNRKLLDGVQLLVKNKSVPFSPLYQLVNLPVCCFNPALEDSFCLGHFGLG